MPRHLLLQGFARQEAVAGTWNVKEAIGSVGGFILQARMFSNKAIVLSFELPAVRVPDLARALSSAGLTLYDESVLALERFCEALDHDDTSDVPGSLSIGFVHDGPDEKGEIPSVPG